MIPAAKSGWFSRWFGAQAFGRLRESFGSMHVAGREHLERALAAGPVLVVSNHSAWWDPIVLLVLTGRIVPADAYALMDAANLRTHPYFAKVGAFGVDRLSRRDGAEATRYATSLLDRPGRLVWLFPQGEERPLHERPLRFFGGAARVAQRAPHAAVVPVGLAYGFGSTAAPDVYVDIGAPLPASSSAPAARRAQVAAVEARLLRIESEQSEPGSQGFEAHALRGPERIGALAERMLAMLTRPFVPGLRDGLAGLEQAAGAQPQRALAPAHAGGTEGAGEGGQ